MPTSSRAHAVNCVGGGAAAAGGTYSSQLLGFREELLERGKYRDKGVDCEDDTQICRAMRGCSFLPRRE